MIPGRPAKILLIDSNVYFAKRLGDALKKEGFAVQSSTQPAFALTTLEYDAPSAIVCATNMREMGALEIAKIIHADPKNEKLPIIALGDGSQRALMEAFQAGCEDYIDRQRPPAVIAAHIRQIIISKAEGFQPTQMLNQADTSLSGNLTHHDLPGVLQMLGHAHQTGALHINAGATDAILFFDAGCITHAECGNLFGDEAVIHIIKNCVEGGQGVYKFVYGATSTQHTVLRNATDLMLDAMREFDESARDSAATVGPADRSDSDDALHALSPDPLRAPPEPSTGVTGSLGQLKSGPPEAGCTPDPATIANTASEGNSLATLAESPPVAPALLLLRDDATGATHPETQTESGPQSLTATGVLDLDSAGAHDSSAPLKRSDILQSALSSYPTTITDRVLSDLRTHGDNPVDHALAKLLAEQLSGNNADPQPQSSDSGAERQQDGHVQHANNIDKEHP